MRVCVVLCVVALLAPVAVAQESLYENLKVLPHDVTRDQLSDVMLEALRGLGLRRRAGEGCLYCHVGDLETPRGEWDYASDAKPMKAKGRVMMALTLDINERLGSLASRTDDEYKVTCTTCHAGRIDPRPLPDVLWDAYETDGMDAVATKYGELRERYFAADAYDFRPHVLTGLATHLADRDAIDDAIALADLNAEANPEEPSARRAWVQLTLERTIDRSGAETALAELAVLEKTLPPEVVGPSLLDGLAWRLNRSDRESQGHALIEANYEKFPDVYFPLESMAFILASTDRKDEAFALLNGWLEKHPDDERARRLIVNLEARD